MRRADIDDLPNPFSIDQFSSRPERLSLINRLKFFGLIAVLLAMLLAMRYQYGQLQLKQISGDFTSLSSADKLQRIGELSSRGVDGIPTLVDAMADPNPEVADSAHEQLRQMQASWTVIESDQAIYNQNALVDSIKEKNASLTESGQQRLAIELLQQAAHVAVEQADEATRQLYFDATTAIDQLSTSHQSTGQVANHPAQVDDRTRPLPVDHLARGVDWTAWPPRDKPAAVRDVQPVQQAVAIGEPTVRLGQPTIHRSAASPLRAVPEGEAVVLREVPQERTYKVASEAMDADRATDPLFVPPATIQPVVHMIDTFWHDAQLSTVIKFLARPEQQLQEQAQKELARRGLSAEQIAVAKEIGTGDLESKTVLIHSLSQNPNFDGRPWLLMLLDDPNREVRLRTVSALAELDDPWVRQQLKLRMVDEQDQTVAFRIRRILKLR